MGNKSELQSDENAKVLTTAILSDLEATIAGSPEVAAVIINSSLAAVEVLIFRYGIRKNFIKETYDMGWKHTVDRLITDEILYHQR